jgi:hypothetical protein
MRYGVYFSINAIRDVWRTCDVRVHESAWAHLIREVQSGDDSVEVEAEEGEHHHVEDLGAVQCHGLSPSHRVIVSRVI